jgi:hypothetical protein
MYSRTRREQSQGNSQSESAEPAAIGAELPPHTIRHIALEAALRDVKIEELIAEIITAMVNKDLFPLVFDNIDPES